MQKHFKRIFNLALVGLFLALTGAWEAGVFAQTPTPTPPKTWDWAAESRRAVDTIGAKDFKRAKDRKLRDAGTRALAALKKIAKNTSKAREAALVADFDRAMQALKLVLPATKSGGLQTCDRQYEICMELCKETGGDCSLCSKANNVCYIMTLTMEQAQENDPKNDP